METIALPTLSGVEHAYVDLPGLRMHVAEAGAGEPVLLLHGFPQHWWEWRGIIPRLAPYYRVICPDLRGAGWTDAPAEGYTSEQQRADVLALLDCLGLDRIRLVAHDWSAIVGFQLATHRPERIEQYVSLATPHPWIRFRPAMLRGAWRLWFQPVIATPGLGPRLLARGDQRLARYLLEQDGAGGALRSAEDREAFLAPLRQPERARAGSAIYRGLILPELRRIVTGGTGRAGWPCPPSCSTAPRIAPWYRMCTAAMRRMRTTSRWGPSRGRRTSWRTSGRIRSPTGSSPSSARREPRRRSAA